MTIYIENNTDHVINENLLQEISVFTLNYMKVSTSVDVNIILIDLDDMEELHIKWLNLPGPTDVMSFPMDEIKPGFQVDHNFDEQPILGDILLCPAFAENQAQTANHSLEKELNILTVHGILHMLGYDHVDAEERKIMFGLQKDIISEFSVGK